MPKGQRPQHDATYPTHLRAWREEKGMSQRELAQRVGVSQASISLWETCERKISVTMLAEVARCLGVTPIDLLRDPRHASLDALVSQRPELRDQAEAIIRALMETR